MKTNTLEVVRWYEERLKRNLTEAEKASIRCQCIFNNLENKEICLNGLKYMK